MNPTEQFQRFTSSLQEFFTASLKKAPTDPWQEPAFNRLVLELFALQFSANTPFRTYCRRHGFSPETVRHWSEIPAVPSAAFKDFEFSCLMPHERSVVFHSSGTTIKRPSRHFHSRASLNIYEASLLPWFERHLLPVGSAPNHSQTFLILTPSPAEAPHSSLVHMFETVRRMWHSEKSIFVGRVTGEGTWCLEMQAAEAALRGAVQTGEPVIILGTAFSYVQLLDELHSKFKLPPGSRVLETGGYKGQSRALPKSELYLRIANQLGILQEQIISEYGMSELSSQAYDSVAGKPLPWGARTFQFPPWVRTLVVSPETGDEVLEGSIGLLRVFDLANVYSALALQTEDLVLRQREGIELIGRAEMAEPRGCSLQAV